MTTTLYTHSACLEHDTGGGHPECPDRLRYVLSALESEEFMFLDRAEAPLATRDQLLLAHPEGHVDHLLDSVPDVGFHDLDGDTVLSPGSGEAALRAAGAAVASVDDVVAGQSQNAFCATRPPGHHAEAHRAMGFCLFNNAAIAALHAQKAHGLKRVVVIDFDVHHGNGTQDIFWSHPDLLYVSTHQAPLYPGTGEIEERGVASNILNVPLPERTGSPEFRHAMSQAVLPAIDRFSPELLIISAGFDGHTMDPLAGMDLTEDDFAWATRKLCDLAAERCERRVVSLLEGGYNLRALASSAAAHVRELMA